MFRKHKLNKIKVISLLMFPKKDPSCRYRVYQYKESLKRYKILLETYSLYSDCLYNLRQKNPRWTLRQIIMLGIGILRRFIQTIYALQYDILFVHRQTLPGGCLIIEKILKRLGKKIIYDFDDAIFLPNNGRNGWSNVSEHIKIADAVIVGNNYLAEYAKKYNKNVHVIPSVIDINRYMIKDNYEIKTRFKIGWIGSPSTVVYLEIIKEALYRLSKEIDYELVLIGGKIKLDGINTKYIEWSEENEVNELPKFDIGISPLPDNEWTRGKCGVKLLQYMAVGLPVVASAVGVHNDIIQNGENGFLAYSNDDWYEIIKKLINDKDLREKIGKKARITVERKYNLEKATEELAKIIEEVINK